MSRAKMIRQKVLLFAAAAFLLWNVLWVVNYVEYSKLGQGYELYYKTMGKTVDDYQYSLRYPDYLSFHGNFAISNNDDLCIIIWPSVFLQGEYTFGVQIYDEDADFTYRFYVDEQLAFHEKQDHDFVRQEIDAMTGVLQDRKEELGRLMDLARAEWHI